MNVLILYTFGILAYPDEHQSIQAFRAAAPAVSAGIPTAPGMLKGMTNLFSTNGTAKEEVTEFGTPIRPYFYAPPQQTSGLVSLSAWSDPESAAAFSFHGEHGKAMKHRTEWFVQDHDWPSSVLWWTSDLDSVTWEVAELKLQELHAHGSSQSAFTFRSLHEATGKPTRLDNQRVKELASDGPD